MAKYTIDLQGNVTQNTTQKKKKKNQAKYQIDLDGNVTRVGATGETKTTSPNPLTLKNMNMIAGITAEQKRKDVLSIPNQEEEKKETWFNNPYKDLGKMNLTNYGDFIYRTVEAGLGTGLDAVTQVAKGAGSMVEGIKDLATYGVAGAADLFGADEWADKRKKEAQASDMNLIFGGVEDYLAPYSFLGEKGKQVPYIVGDVVSAMLPAKLIGAAGKGASAAGKTANAVDKTSKAANIATNVVRGTSVAGHSMSEAYNSGASDMEAVTYAGINTAGELVSEWMFGGLGKGANVLGYGKGLSSADDILAKKVSGKINNQIAKNFVEYGIKAGAEGTEELMSGIISAFGKKLSYMSEEELGKIVKDEKLLDQFVMGTVVSGIMQSGYVPGMSQGSLKEANRTGTDFITGYSVNEQKVVDAEVKSRIEAEEKQEGKKLSKKEKAAIEEEVNQDLQKGRISIDSIERALGGDTYQSHKTLMEEMDEYNTLNRTETGKLTGEQSDRLAELKEKNRQASYETETKRLKEQLSKEVSDMTLNDTYLQESYNERGRRSQEYTADVSQYDEKMQETIQRAIDSKILNNTNRTHEFVDLIAKISADKGVSFDFTNNENLKNSGYALNGVTVNGFVEGGNITLNTNSAKALNKVVGHEITHVLEGTEHYDSLAQAVQQYAKEKGEYQTRYDALKSLYEKAGKNLSDTEIAAELTADLVGDYIFADEKFVRQLLAQNRNIFQKVYDEVKYLAKTVTAGTKEAKQLLKAKKLFEQVYRENAKVDTKKTGEVQYSLNVFEDGKQFVKIDQEQERFDGHDRSEYPSIAKQIINEKFNGKVVGQDNKMYVNGRGRDEYIHPSNPIKDHYVYDAKMRASGEIDNLLDAGERLPNETDGKDGHVHKNALEWEYYKTLFKVGDNYFEGVVNIEVTNRGKLFKDVTKIKDVTEAIMNSYGENPKFQFLRTSSNSIVAENQKNATENQKLSLGKDDIAPLPKGWEVKGKDIALEHSDEIAPVRKDIAPAQKTDVAVGEIAPLPEGYSDSGEIDWDNAQVSDDLDFGPFSASDGTEQAMQTPEQQEEVRLRKDDAKKIKNIRANIKGLNVSKDITLSEIDAKIAEKKAEYEGLKDKTTYKATNLLIQIENLQAKRTKNLAEFDKRIGQQLRGIEIIENRALARSRKTVQQQYRKEMSDLMGDTSTWKDKKLGISYQTSTFKRNLRDIIKDADGNPDYAKADAIYDATQGAYNRNEAELKRESRRIKQPFADMKINNVEAAYIQMLGEYKYNPDCELSSEVIQDYYNKNKQKIDDAKVDKAIELARKTFDSLFYRVNSVLREQGMKEIPYREGYFPHFTEESQNWLAKLFNWKAYKTDIPTDIAGLTEQFNPDRSWQSFNKRRTSDTTDYNFLKGLDTYVHGALDWIYHIEDIQKRRALENEIRYQHSPKGIKEQIEALHNNPNLNADELQEAIDAVYKNAKNPLNNFVQDLRKGTNNLAGKKDSADRSLEARTNRQVYATMTNLSNRVTANMVVGSISSAMTNFIPITQSWGQVSPVSSLVAMKDTIGSMVKDDGVVNKSDFLTNRLQQEQNLYQSFWDKASDKAGFLMEVIDNFTSQVVWRSKYRENLKSGMSEEQAIKNADQFSENVIAGRSRGNMPTVFNEKNPITKVVSAFQLEVANQYGYMFKDMPQDIGKNATGKLVKGYLSMFIGAYAYNALYSTLTGRDAAFDPIGILEDLLRDLGVIGGDDEDEEKDSLVAIEHLAENVLEEVPFIGGLMGGGRNPISSALPYEGLSLETLKQMGQDVKDGDMKSLTKQWLKPLYYLGMPIAGGQLKKSVEGLQMFDDDFPIAGSYTDSGKLRFSVEDDIPSKIQAGVFGQYSSKNARQYFDEGRTPLTPKKAQALAGMNISIDQYWSIQDELKKIQSDKDKNGKTISGSRKNKVVEFINGLDMKRASKLILFKSEFPKDDTYNEEIVEYLNNREELSRKDVEGILKGLGFEVESDGTVRW